MLLILFRQQCFSNQLPLASSLPQRILDLLVDLLWKMAELNRQLCNCAWHKPTKVERLTWTRGRTGGSLGQF